MTKDLVPHFKRLDREAQKAMTGGPYSLWSDIIAPLLGGIAIGVGITLGLLFS